MAGRARFFLKGVCTRDPGFAVLKDGKVRKFDTCIVTEDRTDRSPEPTPSFHNVIAWNGKADILIELVKKGSMLTCEGNIKNRKDGDRTFTDLEIDWFEVDNRDNRGV